MEDAVVPNSPGTYANDKNIYYDTINDDSDILISSIDPLQDEML